MKPPIHSLLLTMMLIKFIKEHNIHNEKNKTGYLHHIKKLTKMYPRPQKKI